MLDELLWLRPQLETAPITKPVSPWTKEVQERLEELLKTPDLSAYQIALALGPGFTRNSVLGRVFRLGLEMPMRIGKHGPNHHRGTPRKGRAPVKGRQADWAPQRKVETEKLVGKVHELPTVYRCRLMDLTNETCRWPNGEPGTPGFYFCGIPEADLMDHRPYCDHHTAMAKGHRVSGVPSNYQIRNAA